MGRLGTILGPSWASFGPSGAILNHLGARLSRLEAKTGSRRPHVAKTLFFARNFNVFLVPLGAFLELSGAWCDGILIQFFGPAECADLPKGNSPNLAYRQNWPRGLTQRRLTDSPAVFNRSAHSAGPILKEFSHEMLVKGLGKGQAILSHWSDRRLPRAEEVHFP